MDEAIFPNPVDVVNLQGSGGGILLCDHASNKVPSCLEDMLGLTANQLEDHIAWDIGAGWVTRKLSERLDMPAVLCNYSRLLIDCNRKLDDPSSIPELSDGIIIPGNKHLSDNQRTARVKGIFEPYHATIKSTIDHFVADRGYEPVLFSIHSMTSLLQVGAEKRPWEISVLWHSDERISQPLLSFLREYEDCHGYCVGANQPYSGLVISGYTTPTHGLARNIPHVIIEMRNDCLQHSTRGQHIVDVLVDGFKHVLTLQQDIC
eukprot:gene5998-9124_t